MTASFPKIDGRNARAERTRDAVAAALLALIEDDNLRPTAAEVADRAGVSLRSVFQHFEDMESLYAAVAAAQMARLGHYVSQEAPNSPMAARLHAFVERRSELLEMVTPVRRAAILQEPFSQTLAARLRWAHDMARDEVERTFAPEIGAIPSVNRNEVATALDVATNWPAWDSCRRLNGLSIDESKRVMAVTIKALLGIRTPRTAKEPNQ